MKTIEPTHKEIMRYLNCCHYGYYNKNQCVCHNHKQFKYCYENAKKRLTNTEYTEEEIAEAKEHNKKAMEELDRALACLYEYEEN